MTRSAQSSLQAPSPAARFAGEYDDSANLNSSVELRQGDVLELISDESRSEFERHFGVVVTADCDLALNKHFGVITYIPVIPVECYVHRFVLPKVLAVEENKSKQALKNRVLEKHSGILYDRIMDMISSNDYTVDEICSGLSGKLDIRKELVRHIAIVAAVDKARQAVEPNAAISSLADLANVLDSTFKPKKSSINAFFADIQNRLTKSMSGDCLFLSRISPNHGLGYTAILRMLRELPHDRVALSATAEQRARDWFVARRISRLSTLYVHRLVQQMGQVFTDIGLPADYETTRDAVVSGRLQELLSLE